MRRDFYQPLVVLALLLAAATAAAYAVEPLEARRIAAGSLAAAATLFGCWTWLRGLVPALPVLRALAITRATPERLATFLLYRRILVRIRGTLGHSNGRDSMASRVALGALRLGNGPASWEAMSYRLSAAAGPRLVRYALLQAIALFGAPVLGWWVIRLAVVPPLIREGTGLGAFATILYPFAALVDAVTGSAWRAALLT